MKIHKNKLINNKKYLKLKGRSYSTIHNWMYNHYERLSFCERCKSSQIPKNRKRWFEWANISGKYLRKREDWETLCIPCHKKKDHPFGTHPKLNQFQVLRMRLLKEIKPTITYKRLSEIYKTPPRTVWNIINKITWKHI